MTQSAPMQTIRSILIKESIATQLDTSTHVPTLARHQRIQCPLALSSSIPPAYAGVRPSYGPIPYLFWTLSSAPPPSGSASHCAPRRGFMRAHSAHTGTAVRCCTHAPAPARSSGTPSRSAAACGLDSARRRQAVNKGGRTYGPPRGDTAATHARSARHVRTLAYVLVVRVCALLNAQLRALELVVLARDREQRVAVVVRTVDVEALPCDRVLVLRAQSHSRHLRVHIRPPETHVYPH